MATWPSIHRHRFTPRPVAAEAALAAYRTAQEALTNARKHAPGQPVRLSECLIIRVIDLGRGGGS